MKYTFDLEYLLVLLAATAVAFMIWVFWNLAGEIRGELRTRVRKPLAVIELENPFDEACSEQTAGVEQKVRSWTGQPQARARRTTMTPRAVR
jgi:hypothetical protein